MDKKNNMKQAMYEMFGVGTMPEEAAAESVWEESVSDTVARSVFEEPERTPVRPVEDASVAGYSAPKYKAVATYLAPGTVMEGTLRAKGDVEIAGDFKGDIITEGTVILHANIQGNLTVSSLNLTGCKLVGDVVASDVVTIGADSEVRGNVTARTLQCAGQIAGDVSVTDVTALDSTAQVYGNIRTGSMAVSRGAVIKGMMEVKPADAK